jgi:thymidylate synthase
MTILDHVAGGAGLETGPITVISHSLTINPMETRFAVAEELVRARKKDDDYDREKGKYVLREDPNGHFAVSLDEERGEIVATHVHNNVVLKKYTGRSAQEVEEEIARDMAVSVISHALWLGRQLGIMEAKLRGVRARERV